MTSNTRGRSRSPSNRQHPSSSDSQVPYTAHGPFVITNQDASNDISRGFVKGHWLDSILLAKEYVGQRRCTYVAHYRLLQFIKNPHHDMKAALADIAAAHGDILKLQTTLTLNTANLADIDHAAKCKQAIVRSIVLGILAIQGHKSRPTFLRTLSDIGIWTTDTQQACLQEYFAVTAGIPGAFLHTGTQRRSRSNKKWMSYAQYGETMDELANYNQGFNGPLHMAHNDPIRRPHTMQVSYQPYDGNYRGPFDLNSPFSYFPLVPETTYFRRDLQECPGHTERHPIY